MFQVFKKQALAITQKNHSVENSQETMHGEMQIKECNKFQVKAYYSAIKEIFAILALSFLSDNKTAFISCKP